MAIPESVLQRRVDRSTDDLISRIDKLDTLDDGIAFLQGLTFALRERLARSGMPLADFADVQTPEQAIARFQSLDQRRRLQLIAMFNRVEDEQG